jgi:hypothetical protein
MVKMPGNCRKCREQYQVTSLRPKIQVYCAKCGYGRQPEQPESAKIEKEREPHLILEMLKVILGRY